MKYRNYLLLLAVVGMVSVSMFGIAAEVRVNSTTQSPQAGNFYYETDLDAGDYTSVGIGRTHYLGGRGSGDTSWPSASEEVPPETMAGAKHSDADDKITDIPAGVEVDGLSSRVAAHFDFDKADIRAEIIDSLDKTVGIINGNPGVNFIIQGHTCNLGPLSYNQVLSEKRARAVYDYFVSKGVDARRLTCTGLAYTRPAAANDTDEGRALNRRVEVLPVKPSE